MGKSFKDNDWADLQEQLNPEFFDAPVPVFVEDATASEIPISVSVTGKEEATEEQTVAVRFTSEGFAEEVYLEEEPRHTSLLEAMPLPLKQGVSEAGGCFAEVMARVQEMNSTSKLAAIRYEARGVGLKVSSLPSAMDFVADVQIVARKAMSPALYLLFKEIYFDGYGKNASRIPEKLQTAIIQKCGLAWKKSGIHPWGTYWTKRVNLEQIKAVTLSDLDTEEDRKQKLKDARNARRRARRVISTLAIAA
jgi:hypothetical protein